MKLSIAHVALEDIINNVDGYGNDVFYMIKQNIKNLKTTITLRVFKIYNIIDEDVIIREIIPWYDII